LSTVRTPRGNANALQKYLTEKYNFTSFWYAFSSYVLGCDGELQRLAERPVTICDAIAIWPSVDEVDDFWPLLGLPGGADHLRNINPVIADAINPVEVPPRT